MNNFNLKELRENSLKLTQSELAEKLDMRQDAISRLEKNPDQITLDVLLKLADKFGMNVDQLISYKKPIPRALNVSGKWSGCNYLKQTIGEYVDGFKDSHPELDSNHETIVQSIQNVVENSIRKPKLVLLGRSDSGKSTMANALIGMEKMPTDWTPTTSITVYIKSIEDRPSFIEEELWIFKRGKNEEAWDDSKLNDEAYCRAWKLAGGSAEMLSSYGIRTGSNYTENEVGSAVLFVDSEILKNCDLVDVPGFTGGIASDNQTALAAKDKADILIYLSQAGGGFLSGEDFVFVKEALNVLKPLETAENGIKPLGNLFIVGTQAHVVNHGNKETIEKILDDGCNRIFNTITEAFWENRSSVTGLNYDRGALRARFFSYTTDIEDLRYDFENDLRDILEKTPDVIRNQCLTLVKQVCIDAKENLDKEIDEYNRLIDNRDECLKHLNYIDQNERNRKEEAKSNRRKVKDRIKDLDKESKENFKDHYEKVLGVEHITETIEKRKFRSKKEDMQALSSLINSELEEGLHEILTQKSELIKDDIEEYIGKFNSSCTPSNKSVVQFTTSFNATRAFASGLAGAGTYGALALWAASLGNLGGYILVAKGVSLLSALGISISGGTAAVITAISSIGGPVVLGIALAVIAAIGVFAVFSGGWQKKVAKKIKDAYSNQNAFAKYNNHISSFWNDTRDAFDMAADNMETEWNEYITNLKTKVNDFNIEELRAGIKLNEEMLDFFQHIPLLDDGMGISLMPSRKGKKTK